MSAGAARRRPARAPAAPAVVFDLTLLLRALLLSDTAAKALRQSWQQGRCRPLICTGTAEGLMRALLSPGLGLDKAQCLELLADFLPYAQVVQLPVRAGARSARLTGLQQQVLRLARQAPAQLLVSDNPEMKRSFVRSSSAAKSAGCEIIGSAEFLAAF